MALRLFIASGAAITTSYVAGATVFTGRPSIVRAHALMQAGASSTLGGVVFKWQATVDPKDPNRWTDVQSTRDDTGATELEHGYPIPAGARAPASFRVDARGHVAMRLLVRAIGNGQAGDQILVDGVPW
jgi:hypothetical protein